MTNKITVIGGSGFVGTNLCKYLAAKNIDFEIVDLRLSNLFPQKTQIADIRDLDTLRKTVTGDIVIHLAAVHRDDIRDKDQYWQTNVYGSSNVAQLCTEKNIKKIIFTSSVAVYGSVKKSTDETGITNPSNDYGRTKLEAENILNDWQKNHDNSLIIVRPTVIFGEGNRGNVFNLINQIFRKRFLMIGQGKNIKSMAYVENIISFLAHCIKTDYRYEVFNYSDTPSLTMNELVSLANEILHNDNRVGVRLPYWLGLSCGLTADAASWITRTKLPISRLRVQKFVASSEFTSSKLDQIEFQPELSLAEGLKLTIINEFIDPSPDRDIFYTE